MTRPCRRFLVLHGDDWPRPDGLERAFIAFGLDRRRVVLAATGSHPFRNDLGCHWWLATSDPGRLMNGFLALDHED